MKKLLQEIGLLTLIGAATVAQLVACQKFLNASPWTGVWVVAGLLAAGTAGHGVGRFLRE